MKILLVNNNRKKDTLDKTDELAAKLKSRGISVVVDQGECQLSNCTGIDSIIVLGGDGTMIRTARQYLEMGAPILGVNMGTVGFLSNVEADELEDYLDKFIQGDYTIDERMMLQLGIYQDGNLIKNLYSLNELSIKSSTSRMISMDIKIAEREHGIYRGDGIIIATPTGSTAYSLSTGGPITDPALDAFIMTPLASFLLSKRPMVISAEKEICLTALDCKDTVISIDGQVKIDLKENYIIKITKADYKLKMVNLSNRAFFQTIDRRLRRDEGSF